MLLTLYLQLSADSHFKTTFPKFVSLSGITGWKLQAEVNKITHSNEGHNVMAKFIKYFVFNIFPLKIFSLRSKTQEVYKVY